jgi:anti-sigma-K factor RskA
MKSRRPKREASRPALSKWLMKMRKGRASKVRFNPAGFLKLTMVLTLVLTLIMLALPVALEQTGYSSTGKNTGAVFSQSLLGSERR